MTFRYLSVCSGIEAATVAWKPLGWQCAGVSEIEKFPRAVLEHRMGAVPVDDEHRWREGSNTIPLFGDFTRIEAHHVGPVDLLVGGTPCQSFSIAGKRLGLDDPRGNLTLEFLALARRLRPRWIVWENVPGVLSHDNGRTMGTFLRLVGECGFRWAYRVLDAQYVRVDGFGRAVPQRRRRVFLVGYSGAGGVDPRAVLFDRESLRGNPAPRREAGQISAPTLAARTRGGGGLGTDFDCDGGLIAATVAPTMRAGGNRTGGDRPPGTDVDTSESLVAHALRGEGFDASEDGTGRGTPIVPVAYRTTGNDGAYETGDVVGALDTQTDPNARVVAFSAKDHGADAMADCSPTLRAGGHAGSHANAGVMPAVAFQTSQSGVRTDAVHATLDSNNGSRRHNGALIGSAVRRLTPRECERLQGFPDDFTQIAWRRKDAAECPDGPRYKALGNSMAVNVMAWIGERIEAVEAAASTKDEAA